MAELNYVKGLTLNFNLRKPSSKKPTNVYAVVKVCGKQIKIPTTAKINAYLWNSKKQVPMMFDSMSDAERDNAKQVLSIILSFQNAFSDYYCYITYSDSRGKIQTKRLSDIISSHFGRHTFVTRMARIVPLETLKFLTGHKDTQALQKYYLHQTEDDKVNLVTKALKGNNDVDGTATQRNNILNILFDYDRLLNIEHAMKNNINFNTDCTKQVIDTIKNVVGLSSYPKDIDKDKIEALDKTVFELSYYFRDAQLYSAFQYKEHYFGIIDKVSTYDEIIIMFANEDIERPKLIIDAQIEEYENR